MPYDGRRARTLDPEPDPDEYEDDEEESDEDEDDEEDDEGQTGEKWYVARMEGSAQSGQVQQNT